MPATQDDFNLEEIADCAWLLRFDDSISREVNERVHAAARALRSAELPGVVDIVPAYSSLAVVFDEPAVESRDALAERVYELALGSGTGRGVPRRTVEIPVAYGGEQGPDLAELATRLGMDAEEIVRRHTAADYIVGMLGFLPGFPYLIGLDASLAAPRRATPRTRVPAGSVGIGGAQTGIYPIEPGDCLRFRAVDARSLARAEVSIATHGTKS